MRSVFFTTLYLLLSVSAFCQWKYVGNKGFTPFEADFVCIAINPISQKPCVAFRDIHNYSKTSVMEFNGNTWEFIGSPGFSDGDSDCQSLAFSPDGTPYVAYMDGGHNRKATVMKFNGSKWEAVGRIGFSDSAASCESIAIDKNGIPYIAFRDAINNYGASVMKFNGSSWEYIGAKGFTDPVQKYGGPFNLSLTLDNNGIPYIAYQDFTNGSITTIKRFNGTNWENVGTPGFAGWNATWTRSMAFDSKNTPYFVGSSSGHVVAFRFENNTWAPLGTPMSTQGGCEYASIAIGKSDTVFLAYQDYGVTRRASAVKYDGTKWVYVGQQGFSSSSVQYVTCDVDADRNLYIAFADNDTPQWNATVMKFLNANAVGIKKNDEIKTSFEVYPNPASKNITILFQSQTLSDLRLTFKNNIGQIISSKDYPAATYINETYDLTRFSKGIYFVEMAGNNCHECKKLVIE
jgi:hypothetical protein